MKYYNLDLKTLEEMCGCQDHKPEISVLDLDDGVLDFDEDDMIEPDYAIELVDDEYEDEQLDMDVNNKADLKRKIMQAISTVLGETKGKDKLRGGKADFKPDSKYNKKELKKGIKHEKGEHTKDTQVAKETAEDHLEEDPKYYTHLKKAGLDEAATSIGQPQQQIRTYGDLKGIINKILTSKRAAGAAGYGASAAVDIAVSAVANSIPGVGVAKTLYDVFKSVYSATDDKKSNTWLDKLNVDDNYSKIVDDSIENQFIKFMADAIMKQKDETPLPANYNINVELQNYLKTHYASRTLTTIKEEQSLNLLEYLGDDTAITEDGELVCEACLLEHLVNTSHLLSEAKYHGKSVPLNKPMHGDVKKSKVYVRDPKTGNIKKVNFGDKHMRIKKNSPSHRRSFRARHHCENPGPKTKARYWSCRAW